MSLHHIVFAAWLTILPGSILPAALLGQAPATDTAPAYSPYGQPQDSADSATATPDTLTRRAGADSLSPPDSAAVIDSAFPGDTTQSPDSLRLRTPGQSAGADSGRSTADTIRSPGVRDTAKSPPTAASQPVDSVLSAACGGPGASGTIARDLLVVKFAEDATPEERAAVARTVQGKLVGQPEPGSYYVRIPSGGGELGLRMAADQLSLVPQVRQVGSKSCPPPSRGTTR